MDVVAGGDGPPSDSGLRCPGCEYNLTGLAGNRCPECGRSFNLKALKRALAGQGRPVPGWDDGRQPPLVAFVLTCLRIWFTPLKFAMRFPSSCLPSSAVRFRRLALLAAMAMVVFGLGMTWAFSVPTAAPPIPPTDSSIAIVLASFAGLVAAIQVCERLLVDNFSAALRRTGCACPQSMWRDLVGFHRSFLLLGALVLWPAMTCPMILLLVPAWWWLNLSLTATQLATPGSYRFIAVAMIPVIAFLSISIGGFVSLVSFFLLGGR
jgi:hypothetical protein